MRYGCWPADERALVEAGLLPGVDFCRHALRCTARGRLVGPRHLAACAVCLRRWRVTEAELQGWRPMTHERAQRVMEDVAAAFAGADRDEVYRPFYAHVARCGACERRLAELTFDRTPATAAGCAAVTGGPAGAITG
jgi:hypothetical protein